MPCFPCAAPAVVLLQVTGLSLNEAVAQMTFNQRVRSQDVKHALLRAANKAEFYHGLEPDSLKVAEVLSHKTLMAPRIRHHGRGARAQGLLVCPRLLFLIACRCRACRSRWPLPFEVRSGHGSPGGDDARGEGHTEQVHEQEARLGAPSQQRAFLLSGLVLVASFRAVEGACDAQDVANQPMNSLRHVLLYQYVCQSQTDRGGDRLQQAWNKTKQELMKDTRKERRFRRWCAPRASLWQDVTVHHC